MTHGAINIEMSCVLLSKLAASRRSRAAETDVAPRKSDIAMYANTKANLDDSAALPGRGIHGRSTL